jgi:chromosome segregation ATPase
MENNAELVRLEQFVDKLLVKYRKLQEMCGVLETNLEARDAECVQLKEQIAELRSERTQVGNKVAGLIDRIEQWEEEHDQDAEPREDEAEGAQGKLFSGEAQAAGHDN